MSQSALDGRHAAWPSIAPSGRRHGRRASAWSRWP